MDIINILISLFIIGLGLAVGLTLAAYWISK